MSSQPSLGRQSAQREQNRTQQIDAIDQKIGAEVYFSFNTYFRWTHFGRATSGIHHKNYYAGIFLSLRRMQK